MDFKEDAQILAKRFGARFLERQLDNKEFWKEIIRKIMNPKIDQIYPQEMVYAFEQKMEIKSLFREEHTQVIRKFVEGNEDILEKIKKKFEFEIPGFEWEAIEIWWKKDHPKLLGVIINHPRSPEFKLWLVTGITELTRKIISSV